VGEASAKYEGTISSHPTPPLIVVLDSNVRLSQADFDALGREEGVALPDGGYAGVLNVYHELHCIVRLPGSHFRATQLMIFSSRCQYVDDK
jgi:hypothetical protein